MRGNQLPELPDSRNTQFYAIVQPPHNHIIWKRYIASKARKGLVFNLVSSSRKIDGNHDK
jgi:hypothetical protein